MFKLVISDTVSFPVEGTLTGEDGAAQRFDFTLVAKRESSTELDRLLRDEDRKTSEFMAERVTGWKGVVGADGQPAPFSAAALAQLFAVPGIANLAYLAYLQAVGAKGKAKN